jgi:2-polyprenyl-3-methyl-5-hydroxy-6-metoxy-1,4-benzoquinol methylase
MPIAQPLCPICESSRKRGLPCYHEWNGVRWRHVRCRACGHRYTDPMPTAHELERMYGDEYFEDGGEWVCGYWSGGYLSNEALLRSEARDTLALLPATGPRMLEIGAAGGFFLDEARSTGFDVHGIELNRTMADWGRLHLGLDMVCTSFEAAEIPEESFDVVVAQDVLEHVREPREFVEHVARILTPGGVFLVRGPLEQSWKDRFYLAVRRWLHRGFIVVSLPPYHLQGFVRRSFRQVVEASGMAVTSFRAMATRPRLDLSSPKSIVATAIELGAWEADRVTATGDFMVGCAIRAAVPSRAHEVR